MNVEVRHSRESGNPEEWIFASKGHSVCWIPAFAGIVNVHNFDDRMRC